MNGKQHRRGAWVWRGVAGLILGSSVVQSLAANPATAPATTHVAATQATRQLIYSVVTNAGEDCSTQMNIGWHADLGVDDCVVSYTTKADSGWAEAKRVAGKGVRTDVFNGIPSKTPAGVDWNEDAVFLDYGVTLTNLRPDTEYLYRVSGGGTQSATYSFKTAGAPEFSFVWISDYHAYTPLPNRLKNATKILSAAAAIDPSVDFVFSTGDVIAWGGSYSFWRDMYEQPFFRDYLFACVIGNHDHMMRRNGGKGDFFDVACNNPRNGYPGQQGVCYWFLYGDVLFITLNNEEMKKDPASLQAAKDWAAGVIRQQAGRYKHIFLAEHYQWFDGRNGKSSWYEQWKDFCDEHRVTLALAGNNHVYARTHPLYAGNVVPDGQGTVYMQAPSSDGERGVEAGPVTLNADKLAHTWSSHIKSGGNEVKTVGCVLVNVSKDGITTKLVYLDDATGEVKVADEHTTRFPSTQPAGK